ncbi:MAG: hypothetical protein D6725_02215, partial [Planctomycetota bacterium]
RLLEELSRAAGVPIDRRSPAADHVHRPFIAAALLVTLTIGAGWGAWLLWRIGMGGDFRAASVGHVVAHGDAQLWGFVALFIAGIALRWLPVATATRPASALLAQTTLAAVLLGVAGGFAWAMRPAELVWLGVSSGVALFAAAVLIAGFFVHRVGTRLPQTWAVAVVCAGLWWIAWGDLQVWLRWTHGSSGPGGYSLSERDANILLAVFGVAVNAVYGFGLRLLPGIVGGSVRRRRAALAVAAHNLGLLLLSAGHVTSRAALELAGTSGIAIGAVVFAAALPGLTRLKQFSKRPEQGPPVLSRYVQLAVFWLVAGLLLLLAGQASSVVTGQPMPHAWRGAARHALTVGFLTTLIMGVAQRILPIVGHTLLAWPALTTPILLLVGVGNAWRVMTELATLVWAPAFRIMPVSAVLELAALALFAANALRTLWPRRDPLLRQGRVTERSSVAVLLAEHPWIEDRLIELGVDYLARTRSVPRELTVGSLARSERLDPAEFIERVELLLCAERGQ